MPVPPGLSARPDDRTVKEGNAFQATPLVKDTLLYKYSIDNF